VHRLRGLDLAVMEVLGGELVWCAGNDRHVSAILAAWFAVPNLGDISRIDWASVPAVDVITAGFPCQDISFAGRGAGVTEGTRSSAWNHVMAAVRQIRPGLVVVENVAALAWPGRGMGTVLGDLAAVVSAFLPCLGYRGGESAEPCLRRAVMRVAVVPSAVMILFSFSRQGWESWDVAARPVIREGMPVLVDDDLLFSDAGTARATVAVNRWLRDLPVSGGPAASTWWNYARVLRAWMEFLAGCETVLFDSRDRLRAALGAYAEHRCAGPVAARFEVSTWNQHVSVLSVFYRWAVGEGHAAAEPFTYRIALATFDGVMVRRQVNTAARRRPKPHVTIRYLEPGFAELFVRALRGLAPDGTADAAFRGRNLARNAAVAELALATGLRLAEFTHLLVYELPPLPAAPAGLPVPFPVPAPVARAARRARHGSATRPWPGCTATPGWSGPRT